MKPYALKSLLFVALLTLLGACSSDSDSNEIKEKDLPFNISSFIQIHFPEENAEQIIKNKNPEAEDNVLYSITFSSGITIKFDAKERWKDIESPYIPFTDFARMLLRDEIFEQIENEYPNETITRINSTTYGNRVTLSDGKQLAYSNIFLGIDTTDLGTNELPAKIRDFISTHFPESDFQYIIKNHQAEYTIYLSNNCNLKFDNYNNWQLIEAQDPLPESLISTLSEKLLTELIPYREEREIIGMQMLSPTCYSIMFENNFHYIHHTNSRPFAFPVEAALAFGKKYFNEPGVSLSLRLNHLEVDYNQPFVFIATVPNGFEFIINENEDILSVTGKGSPFPEALYDFMPEKIRLFLINETNGIVTSFDRSAPYGYHVLLTNGEEYKFDLEENNITDAN